VIDARPSWPESVPARLRERVESVLEEVEHPLAPKALVEAAVALTRGLLQDGGCGRASAIDLLAADAMVTHALERLAENPSDFDAACQEAMATLSAIVRD
jgi:predicted nucleic acid-binding protein